MKHLIKKIGVNISSVFLCGAITAGTCMPALAADSQDTKNNRIPQNPDESSEQAQSQVVNKDETVYVKISPDGTPEDITVSDWLKNTDGTASIEDRSDLTDIKNVKGNESFATASDGSMLWNSDGNDIYYQGKTEKELPVSLKITYYLDGKEISADDLAGKSGKVKIRYEYTNHSLQTVSINGKEENIATPFAVVTGMILPGDNFKNVEVSSGKVISDGSKTIVVGMAFPGLEDSLALSDLSVDTQIELPDYIEVTADASDFSLNMAATVVTSSIFDEIGIDNITTAGDLENSLNELQSAANTLVDGSGKLLDGVMALSDASGQLEDGVRQIKNGADALKNGSETLNSGINAYTAGADTLSSGITQYADGADALAQGTKTYALGASMLCDGIYELASKTEDLPDALNQLYEGSLSVQQGAGKLADPEKTQLLTEGNKQITEGIGQLHDTIVAIENSISESGEDSSSLAASMELAVQTLELVKTNDNTVLQTLESARAVQSQVDQVKGLTSENIQGVINSLETQYSQQLEQSINLLNTNISMIDSLIKNFNDYTENKDMSVLMDALKEMENATSPDNPQGLYAGSLALGTGIDQMIKGSQELKTGIDTLTAGTGQLAASAGSLPEGIQQLTEGADTLSQANEPLIQGADDILNASGTLSDGAASLAAQSDSLRNGALSLFEGASALASGTTALNDSVPVMESGVQQLVDGARQLSDGMNTFNEQGIKKLTDTFEGDIQGLMDRMKAVIDAGKDYQTFTDLADGTKGSVKFIIETDPINAE